MTGSTPSGTTRTRRPRPDQPLRARWDPIGDGEPDSDEAPPQNWYARFRDEYGWRAYAIPIMVILTIALIVVTVTDGGSAKDDTSSASTNPDARNVDVAKETKPVGAPTGDIAAAALPSGALPDGGPYTQSGDKTFRVVKGTTDKIGTGADVYTYTVEVEKGMDTKDYGGDSAFGKLVDATLNNPKSWIGGEKVAFRRIDKGEPTLRISLTSSNTTKELCGYQIKIDTSCFYPPNERVVLNEARWVRGATAFAGDDLAYRQYLINHEVGHGIGYEHHKPCETNGALAPIMMQQTFGTANSDILALDPEMQANRSYVCRPNAWPYPDK